MTKCVWGEGALRSICDAIAGMGRDSGRNQAINNGRMRLWSINLAGHLDADLIDDALRVSGRACGLADHELDVLLRDDPTSAKAAAAATTRIPEHRCDGFDLKEHSDPEWTRGLIPKSDDLRSRLMTSEQVSAIPESKPVIDGYLYENTLAWLAGSPRSYKSFMAIHMAACVATGRSFFGETVTRGSVLYVAGEGASGLGRRIGAWNYAWGGMADDLPPITWLPRAVQAQSQNWTELCAIAAELNPRLIILDTQSRMTVGMDENKAEHVSLFVDRADALKAASHACVLTLHHLNRGGTNMRGSSVLDGAADTVLTMRRDDDFNVVEFDVIKQKDVEERSPVFVERHVVDVCRSMTLQRSTKPGGWDKKHKRSVD